MRERKFRTIPKKESESGTRPMEYVTLKKLANGDTFDINYDDYIWMDYIELRDSDQTVLYEDDIVEVSFEGNSSKHVIEYQSELTYPAFDLEPPLDVDSNGISHALCEIGYRLKRIGNIHETPELIGK